ncbi:hypothetical protein RB653_006745 [Dictyostelium firmibasis]|uniref:G-protein coupled receptors family 2 profile 2 domain-containing protein n=1 Tax=Dictyostelium firmibasis TaxID=79012 RepID=A0AAN7TKP8_9MYCE
MLKIIIQKLLLLLFFLIVNNKNLNKTYGLNLPDGYGAGLVDPTATCSSYIGDPIDQPLCNEKLPNKQNIYTSTNITLQFINQIIVEKTYKSLTFLQSKCHDLNFAEFGICDIYFPPCYKTPLAITPIKTVSLPQRLCKSACERMVGNCSSLGASLNCSDPLKFPRIATLYNLSPYGFTANGGFFPVPCSDPTDSFNANPGEMIEVCPSPLLLFNSSDPKYSEDRGYTYLTPTNCVLPCVAPIYSEKKWHQMYNMSKILSTISFVCSIYNVLTFGIMNHRRSKYNYCITFFSASVILITLMDIVTYGIGYEKLLCPEPGRYAVQSDVSCGATGALFHIGITNGVFWWTTMSICLFAVVKRIKLFDFRYFIIFNTTASLISVIIPLAGNAFMAGTGSLACWIRKTWYVNSVFWIPCGISLTIGSTCIILVIYEIYKISKNVSTKDNRMILLQIKPFLCVTLVGGSFYYLFIFNFDNESHSSQYKSAVADYVMCLLEDVPGKECLTAGPNYAAYFIFYFFIRLFGITFFCIYGTSQNARDIWIHSKLLNHPKIKPFLLKYNIINFNSMTHYGSGTNPSNSKNSKNKENNSKKIGEIGENKTIELEVNDSISKTRGGDDEEESNINSASITSSD